MAKFLLMSDLKMKLFGLQLTICLRCLKNRDPISPVGYKTLERMYPKRKPKMQFINIYGLIFIAVIMIPNIIFAVKCKDGFQNNWNNKFVETIEQIGRFGCFAFMIFNIPGTSFGWWSKKIFIAYLVCGITLVFFYCVIWAVCFKKNSIFRTLALSIIPSALFLFSGIMTRSILLIISSLLFAPSHILISYFNFKLKENSRDGA